SYAQSPGAPPHTAVPRLLPINLEGRGSPAVTCDLSQGASRNRPRSSKAWLLLRLRSWRIGWFLSVPPLSDGPHRAALTIVPGHSSQGNRGRHAVMPPSHGRKR